MPDPSSFFRTLLGEAPRPVARVPAGPPIGAPPPPPAPYGWLDAAGDALRGLTIGADLDPKERKAALLGDMAQNVVPVLKGPAAMMGMVGVGPELWSRIDQLITQVGKKGVHPSKLLSMLKSGASQEEVAYRKLPALITGAGDKPITKEALTAHLAKHPAPKVETTVLGAPAVHAAERPDFPTWLRQQHIDPAGLTPEGIEQLRQVHANPERLIRALGEDPGKSWVGTPPPVRSSIIVPERRATLDPMAPPTPPNPVRKQQLEDLATDDAMGVTFDEQDQSFLPSGQSAVHCTACAERIIEMNGGQGEIYGWAEGTNPTSYVAGPTKGARLDTGQGHDFAVLDGRYLVDPWAKNVEGSAPRATFDLYDPDDVAEVRRLYGDSATWIKRTAAGWEPGVPPPLAR